VVDVDIFAPGLNFVFGEADITGKKAIISLQRLRQEFYSLPKNEELFHERVLKEAVHELGHTYGLKHCPNPACVMHFSNSLHDTDLKNYNFCPACKAQLNK
jgi:archaemetzincin